MVPLLSTSKADSGLASEFRWDRALYAAYERMLKEWSRGAGYETNDGTSRRNGQARQTHTMVAASSAIDREREGETRCSSRSIAAVALSQADVTSDDLLQQPTADAASAPKPKFQRRRLTTTGGLKGLPVVTPPQELLAQALRKSKRIKQDMEVCSSGQR